MTVADLIVFNDVSMYLSLTGNQASDLPPNVSKWFTTKMLTNQVVKDLDGQFKTALGKAKKITPQ